jgi:hypothetical protein
MPTASAAAAGSEPRQRARQPLHCHPRSFPAARPMRQRLFPWASRSVAGRRFLPCLNGRNVAGSGTGQDISGDQQVKSSACSSGWKPGAPHRTACVSMACRAEMWRPGGGDRSVRVGSVNQSEDQILADELAALGAAGGDSGRLVRVMAKPLRKDVHEIDLLVPLPFDDAVERVSVSTVRQFPMICIISVRQFPTPVVTIPHRGADHRWCC